MVRNDSRDVEFGKERQRQKIGIGDKIRGIGDKMRGIRDEMRGIRDAMRDSY